MTGKSSLLEEILSKGFKLAEPDDPIYSQGWTISVNPSSLLPEKRLGPKAKSQGSPSAKRKPQSLNNGSVTPSK